MASTPQHESRVTGENAIIKIPEGEEIAVTSVSFDISVNESDVQTNQGLKAVNVTTGLRYSGSFEYDGYQDKIRAQLFFDSTDDAVQDGLAQAGQPKQVRMTVKEQVPAGDGTVGTTRTWTLENVKVTGMSRDVPGDDVASTSWDFSAEDAYVSSGGYSA